MPSAGRRGLAVRGSTPERVGNRLTHGSHGSDPTVHLRHDQPDGVALLGILDDAYEVRDGVADVGRELDDSQPQGRSYEQHTMTIGQQGELTALHRQVREWMASVDPNRVFVREQRLTLERRGHSVLRNEGPGCEEA
jgi:hypothetical protein